MSPASAASSLEHGHPATPPGDVGLTIALFAPNPRALVRYRRCVPLSATVISLSDWNVFASVAPSVDCAVVGIPTRPGDRFLSRLEQLRSSWPHLPIVAVVRSGTAMRSIGRFAPTIIVRERGQTRALWGAVQYACTTTLLQRFEVAVRQSSSVSAPLRAAVAVALTRNPPVRSIAELVALSGQNRRTLWYNWRRQLPSPSLRLEDFIDWLLVLRASIAHAQGVSWSVAAIELGVHRHTLARLVERHLGEHLPDFSPETHTRLRAAFVQNVAIPLLSQQHQ